MYKTILRKKLIQVFDNLNKANYDLIISSLDKNFIHWFIGEHALSGTRVSLDKTIAWYKRLYTIFPNIQFKIKNIKIQGTLWNTTAVIEWDDSYLLLNNEQRKNLGVHIIHFKWAKVDSIRIYCDTRLLLENMSIQEKGGIKEVLEPPIVG